ncbi:hypothetical protein [Prauserella sp. PE36]|uniref:hypothetical protein n=1 Tax=Prauserella sp. PE36 TaxID=1504709 RepID=UPI001F44B278|nr:hypothetical protein [Prauserella sp. PE36]
MIALDPKTGEQRTYATFHQVKSLCVDAPALVLVTQCAIGDGVTFGKDGSMYITDVAQALIWRVPPGGGEAEVWFSDPRIEKRLRAQRHRVPRRGHDHVRAVADRAAARLPAAPGHQPPPHAGDRAGR